MSTIMAATLVAFFALGFFAASLLTLFRFVLMTGLASLGVAVIGVFEGMSLLRGVGFWFGSFALAQVGFGLGLAWVAHSRSRCVPD